MEGRSVPILDIHVQCIFLLCVIHNLYVIICIVFISVAISLYCLIYFANQVLFLLYLADEANDHS